MAVPDMPILIEPVAKYIDLLIVDVDDYVLGHNDSVVLALGPAGIIRPLHCTIIVDGIDGQYMQWISHLTLVNSVEFEERHPANINMRTLLHCNMH